METTKSRALDFLEMGRKFKKIGIEEMCLGMGISRQTYWRGNVGIDEFYRGLLFCGIESEFGLWMLRGCGDLSDVFPDKRKNKPGGGRPRKAEGEIKLRAQQYRRSKAGVSRPPGRPKKDDSGDLCF